MRALTAPIGALAALNGLVLALCRWVAGAALAVMVVFILVQIFFRYVLNAALPWPEEAARFMMLWMTGLAAPAAYRMSGFVAIDMLERAIPKRAAAALSLVLLIVSLAVLVFAVRIGWAEITGFGGRFATAALFLPTALDFSEWYRIPRSWMMASLFVGLALLIAVNVELILRQIATLSGTADGLPPLPVTDLPEAE